MVPEFYTYFKKYGNNIFHRYVDKDGKRRTVVEKFDPTYYILSDEPTEFKNLEGQYLKPFVFGDIKTSADAIKPYRDYDNPPIFGQDDYGQQFIYQTYPKDIKFDSSKIRIAIVDIEVHADDGKFPDPSDANYPVTLITLYDNFTQKFYSFGLGEYTHDKVDPDVGHLDVLYKSFTSEVVLLKTFLRFWQHLSPDAYSGWNCGSSSGGFDFPYLVKRIIKLIGSKEADKFSPFNRVNVRDSFDKYGKPTIKVNILGVESLDYLPMYKKHRLKTQESYKLDHIGHVELGRRKLSYEEEGSLHVLYVTDFPKYVRYNIIDVDIVRCLDEKLGFFELAFFLSYMTKSNFSDNVSPVVYWNSMSYHYLMNKGTVIPIKTKKHNSKNEKFKGAYVQDPKTGKYKWVMTFDLTSLYPSIIRQWNIGPDSFVDYNELVSMIGEDHPLVAYYGVPCVEEMLDGKLDTSVLKEHNLTMTAAGWFYRTDNMSFVSEMAEIVFLERVSDRKQSKELEKKAIHLEGQEKIDTLFLANRLNGSQNAKKVAINALYGSMGSPYFNFFDIRNAESVTYNGQLVIQWIQRRIDLYLNRILNTGSYNYSLYGDTDSSFIEVNPIVEKYLQGKSEQEIVDYLDRFGSGPLRKEIDKNYRELADYLNCPKNLMDMKREAIASAGFWRGKKNYAMRVLDNEGVRKEYIKITGLESVKATLPTQCRKALEECYRIILMGTQEQLLSYTNEFRDEFYKLKPEDIAISISCNDYDKWIDSDGNTISGTPYQVKAAKNYNGLLEKYELSGMFQPIQSGDKIKVIYLKKRNPTDEIVLGFHAFIPKEFEFDKYIDYEFMFNRSFMDACTSVANCVGWDLSGNQALSFI